MDKIGHELVNHFFFISTVPISFSPSASRHQGSSEGIWFVWPICSTWMAWFIPPLPSNPQNIPPKDIFRSFLFFSQCQGNPKPSFFGGYDPYIEGLKPSFFMVLGSKGVGYLKSLQPFAIPPPQHQILQKFPFRHFVCFDRINATVTSVPNNFYRTMLRTSRTWVFIGERLTHQQLR